MKQPGQRSQPLQWIKQCSCIPSLDNIFGHVLKQEVAIIIIPDVAEEHVTSRIINIHGKFPGKECEVSIVLQHAMVLGMEDAGTLEREHQVSTSSFAYEARAGI